MSIKNLQDRLYDIEKRIATLSTATSTASSEINEGQTRVVSAGNMLFSNGGRLMLEGGVVVGDSGKSVVTPDGYIIADNVTQNGDILSASEYLHQREVFHDEIYRKNVLEDVDATYTVKFPDWASRAETTVNVNASTRFSRQDSSIRLYINGRQTALSLPDNSGDTFMTFSGLRTIYGDTPDIRVGVKVDGEQVPTKDTYLVIRIAGVYTA